MKLLTILITLAGISAMTGCHTPQGGSVDEYNVESGSSRPDQWNPPTYNPSIPQRDRDSAIPPPLPPP